MLFIAIISCPEKEPKENPTVVNIWKWTVEASYNIGVGNLSWVLFSSIAQMYNHSVHWGINPRDKLSKPPPPL